MKARKKGKIRLRGVRVVHSEIARSQKIPKSRYTAER